MKQGKWSVFIQTITAVIVGFFFVSQPLCATVALRKLKVGHMPVLDSLQLYVAEEKGFFKQEGLEVELRAVQSGPVMGTMLEAGELDVIASAVMPTTMAVSKGFDFQIIAIGTFDRKGHKFLKIFVRKESPYKSIRDIGGCKIGINGIGTIAHLGFLSVADSVGLNLSNLKILEIPIPQMESALKEGRVDAASVAEPFVTIILTNDVGRVIHEGFFPPEAGDLMVYSWVSKKAWAQRTPDLPKSFSRAVNKAAEFINSNKGELPDIISKYTKLPLDLAKKVTLPAFSVELKKSEIQVTINMMVKYGFLKAPIDAKEIISEVLPMKE